MTPAAQKPQSLATALATLFLLLLLLPRDQHSALSSRQSWSVIDKALMRKEEQKYTQHIIDCIVQLNM